MNDATTGQVSTRSAELYDRLFVPALFDQWPPQLLDAAGVEEGATVLDIGCGTGVLARAAQERVGPTGRVIGVDPNAGMLAVARQHTEDVSWMKGFAEQLPVESRGVDVVVSQFALMFFTDPAHAVAEMRRVLRPGGRLAVATWADIASSPGYEELARLLREVAGSAAADALQAPFSVGTPDALRSLLTPVFPDVRVDVRPGRARFPSVEAWVTTEVKAWTLDELVSDDQLAEVLDAAPRALDRFLTADGTVDFPAPAVVAAAQIV